MSDPTRYAGYVSAETLDALALGVDHIKQRSHALLQLQPGHRVLDVGCGPGTDTLTLAATVGPQGQVWGVDYDPQMIEEASERARGAGVDDWVTHVHADAADLPFEDDYFHGCRSERVFQHLEQPGRALDEMIRVTRPGGWIVLADPDQGTVSIDTPEVDIERRLMRLRAQEVFNNGFAGRRHHGEMLRRGLQDLSVQLSELLTTDYGMLRQVDVLDRLEQLAVDRGVVTRDELERWHASLEQAQDEGTFFGLAVLVTVAGRKPRAI